MAHKFTGVWTCWLLGIDGLQNTGTFDLRNMEENGNIDTDCYHHPYPPQDDEGNELPPLPLKGKVIGFGPSYQLTLTNEFGDFYLGLLSQESDDGESMVIVGKKSYGNDNAMKVALTDQDDPPVVITKP
jgi:hypothetical protein